MSAYKAFYWGAGIVLALDIYGGYLQGQGQPAPTYFQPLNQVEAAVPFGIPLWIVLALIGFAIHNNVLKRVQRAV